MRSASVGTDHGTAGLVFLLADRVLAGLHGPHPELSGLPDGDPRHALDFHQGYASVLDGWLDQPSLPIPSPPYQPFPWIRA